MSLLKPSLRGLIVPAGGYILRYEHDKAKNTSVAFVAGIQGVVAKGGGGQSGGHNASVAGGVIIPSSR